MKYGVLCGEDTGTEATCVTSVPFIEFSYDPDIVLTVVDR
jgi:hypothetical protein